MAGLRKGVSGRPEWSPTPKILQQAEECASRGLTFEQIANALDIANSVLYEKRAKYPELERAIERGRARGVQAVANALFQNATEKMDVKAQTFYLKTKGGFVEEVKKSITITHEDKLKEILGEGDYEDIFDNKPEK